MAFALWPSWLRGGQSNAAPAGAVVAANRRFKSLGRKWRRPHGFRPVAFVVAGGEQSNADAGRRRSIPGPQMEKATWLSPCGLRVRGGGAGRRRGCGQQKVQIPGPQMEKATWLSPCGCVGGGKATRRRQAPWLRPTEGSNPWAANGEGHMAFALWPSWLRGGQSNAAPAGAVVAANRRFKSLGRKWRRPHGFRPVAFVVAGGGKATRRRQAPWLRPTEGSNPWAANGEGHMAFALWPSWLRGGDLNPRPLGYEPNELPDCSTPRHRRAPRHPTTQRYHAGGGRSNTRTPPPAGTCSRRGRASTSSGWRGWRRG